MEPLAIEGVQHSKMRCHTAIAEMDVDLLDESDESLEDMLEGCIDFL